MSTTSENPYASPQTTSESTLGPISAEGPVPASQNTRFINFFIDSVLLNILSFGLERVGGILAGDILGMEAESLEFSVVQLIFFLLSMFMVLFYFIVMEATTGKTIGKLITGTKVVNAQGRAPTIGQIVGRSFARFIPFEPLSFLGKVPRGWHDTLSKTYVVKAR